MLAQELHQVAKDAKGYIPLGEEHGSKFNNDKETPNKRAYLGKGGNVSLRSKGENANDAKSSFRHTSSLQKSRRRK